MPGEDTVWKAEPHTEAKLKILRGYLDAWIPIMSRRAASTGGASPWFIDAFAGPGRYIGGQDGSPLVAIKAAIEHRAELTVPIRMTFIEKEEERADHLAALIETFRSDDPSSMARVDDVLNCSCEEGLETLFRREQAAGRSFGPALVFLDQFGYSQAPMDLIARILENPSCEVLTYLEFKMMNKHVTDSSKAEAYDRAFGSREWQGASKLEGDERRDYLRDAYIRGLRRAGGEYTWHFEMRDARDSLLYWLFFSTSSDRGLEEMKKSMYKIDLTGNFRFSDRHVGQFNLLEKQFDDAWLEKHLCERFEGQRVPLGNVKRYVLTETPRYTYRNALGGLESGGRLQVIDPPPGRKVRSFGNLPASTLLEFIRPQVQESLF